MPVKGRRSRPLLLEGGGNSHMRLAMIGCGAIARAHAAAIEVLPGVELAAVVDNDGEALSKAESELEAPGFGSVDELVAAQIADAACICTPPATHKPLAEMLLGAGLDVLCEKPLATSADDARAMIDTVCNPRAAHAMR